MYSADGEWSETIILPNAGTDKSTEVRVHTNGFGVYASFIRTDKDGKTHSFLLFPEQTVMMAEIYDAVCDARERARRNIKRGK